VPLAKLALMYAKTGITTVDEVLKLIEIVADERALIHTDDTEIIEQELTQAAAEQNANRTTRDEEPKSSNFSFELTPNTLPPNTLPPGGNSGSV
jgi:MSHA biogenesis protein MshE